MSRSPNVGFERPTPPFSSDAATTGDNLMCCGCGCFVVDVDVDERDRYADPTAGPLALRGPHHRTATRAQAIQGRLCNLGQVMQIGSSCTYMSGVTMRLVHVFIIRAGGSYHNM